MFDLGPTLTQRQQAGLYRRRRAVDSAHGTHLVLDGCELLCFCSNDYLGLASHPSVAQAAIAAINEYGVGAGAAHLICGHHRLHHELEEALADFLGRPRALLFSTGYMANLGILTGLLGRGDAVFEDRLNHASLIDGGRYSGADFQRYQHADCADLATRLERSLSQGKLIVTDGVFSMDGDIAPLPALRQLATRHGAWLMVDDAHGLGVLGAHGRGSGEHRGLAPEAVDIQMGTLGKACGVFGAFATGSEELVETLIQEARSYVYTTALPPALAAAALAGLRLIRDEPWRRERLTARVQQFRAGAAALGLQLGDSHTPIQPLLVGEASEATRLSEALLAKGVWVSAIRPPTVPAGSARLRITLSANHTEQEVAKLLEILAEVTR